MHLPLHMYMENVPTLWLGGQKWISVIFLFLLYFGSWNKFV